jgi:signal transduction histidine kinase
VQTDRPREWTAEDARLIDSVAQELRGAIAAAEAFEQQRKAVIELERLSRAKSDFVSIVSHEFRTPLTGIQGFSEMMQSEDLTLDEMREYAGDINKDAHRLNRMITEMLDLDKMESGRMEIHREAVDLNAIVNEAADRMRPNAPEHPLTLRLDPTVGVVSGDRDKLTQVMANLLSNAVKYSPDGGEIVVSTRLEGNTAHIVVRDHGMGIPPAALETIFERYGRVESLATRHIQGTGLGLPIVRQIVQLHGGAVWVESAVGEGSVFHVTLPRGAVVRAEAAEAAS